jgi:hypothetical protein
MTSDNKTPGGAVGAGSRLLWLVLWLAALAPALGQVSNGGFEDGTLGGWATGGGGAVEVVRPFDFNPSISPPEGTYFALLSTGPDDGPGPGGDFDGNGTADFDSSTLSITFDVSAAPTSLSFSWAFLTSEVDQPFDFDDVVLVSLDGVPVLARSVNKPGGGSPFPDTPPNDGVATTVSSAGATDGSSFSDGATPFQTVCLPVETSGSHTLQFLIADQGDSLYDSGLLIDDVRSPSTCDATTVQVTATSGSSLEVKGGGLVYRVHSNRQVALSDDGAVMALVSNGDLTDDNPNYQTQVFTVRGDLAAGGAFERVTATTGADAKSPALTSNGRFLTFAASGDVVPGSPGNADGNYEIFRWDGILGVMTQVTATTGCVNSRPTLSDDGGGRRIALATTCTDLASGFNADGNSEVVIWDGQTGTFQTRETTGCTNRTPAISQHDAGRFVSFVSDCDLTGGNADGNFEIFQWDRVTDTVTQVTASVGKFNDSPSSSYDGSSVAFVSDADYDGSNADPFSLEVFRWDRAGNTIEQLTDTSLPVTHLSTNIDDSGGFVAFDRAASDFEAGVVDAATGDERLVVGGGALPAIAMVMGAPRMAFEASGDMSGNNADGNQEIWLAVSDFASDPDTYCRDVDRSIPNNDSTGISDSVTVTGAKTVSDVDVFLRIEHGAVRDLVVTLEHLETATEVTLIDRPGTPPGGGCTRNDVEAVLDDEAGSPVENACGNPIAISGSFVPNELLAAFDGEGYAGTWRLTVRDERNPNSGTWNEWCLLFTP